MVQDPFIVAVFFGFVPAMGFLYILLHEYQAFFNEKRMFRVFFFGMLAGGLITLLELSAAPGPGHLLGTTITRSASIPLLGLYALLLGLLETGAMAAVLNWRTFRGRRETPFYGMSFGLGFGATSALFQLYFVLRLTAESPGSDDVWVQVILLALVGLYFAGAILIHGAMGAWLGRGAAQADLRTAILESTLARGLMVGLFYAMLLIASPAWASKVAAVAALVFAIVATSRVVNHVLDQVVPPEILREMGIHQRRLARKFLRDDEPEKKP